MDIDASIDSDFYYFKKKLYKDEPNVISAIEYYEKLNNLLRYIMLTHKTEPTRTEEALKLIKEYCGTYE
jgi:hypothetical protein